MLHTALNIDWAVPLYLWSFPSFEVMLCSQKSFAVFGFIFSYFPLVNVFYSLIYAYLFCFFYFSKTVFLLFSQNNTYQCSFHSSLYIVRKCLFGFDKILVFLFVCQGFSSCSMCRKRQCLSVNSRSLPTLKGSQTDELYCDKCNLSSRGEGEGILPYKGYIGMCGPRGCGFSAALFINSVSILAILVIHRWFWSLPISVVCLWYRYFPAWWKIGSMVLEMDLDTEAPLVCSKPEPV